uniref:Uncharacterized protein n=1 Tax=Anopheles albimanus TaxID=7167 RepID=A0A182F2K6_ANOAL
PRGETLTQREQLVVPTGPTRDLLEKRVPGARHKRGDCPVMQYEPAGYSNMWFRKDPGSQVNSSSYHVPSSLERLRGLDELWRGREMMCAGHRLFQ